MDLYRELDALLVRPYELMMLTFVMGIDGSLRPQTEDDKKCVNSGRLGEIIEYCIHTRERKVDDVKRLIGLFKEYKFDTKDYQSGGKWPHRWLSMARCTAKIDVIMLEFPDLSLVDITTPFVALNPFWFTFIRPGKWHLARHVVERYLRPCDLTRKDEPEFIVRYADMNDRHSRASSHMDAARFIKWLIATTDVGVHEAPSDRIGTTFWFHGVTPGLHQRQCRQAMRVFVLNDKRRETNTSATNTIAPSRSFFLNKLYDRNVVGIVASYLYDKDLDIP